MRSNLNAYHPVWKLLSRLFNDFQLKEYEVLILDFHFLINFLKVHDGELNLIYLLSLSRSCNLLANHFTVEMLETYHALYELLTDTAIELEEMFAELSNQYDAEE